MHSLVSAFVVPVKESRFPEEIDPLNVFYGAMINCQFIICCDHNDIKMIYLYI